MEAGPGLARVDVQALLDRATTRLVRYQGQLVQVVGREDYTQSATQLVVSPTSHPGVGGLQDLRTLRTHLTSDFLVIHHQASDEWLGLRVVLEVNGKPVPESRARLVTLLERAPDGVAGLRQLADESARFNLGGVHRNVNNPLLALAFLREPHRSRCAFEARGSKRSAGRRLRVIGFEEVSGPTLIHTLSGEELHVRGELWIAPGTGDVYKTVLTTEGPGGVTSELEVSFKRDPRLGFLVPAEMRESYSGGGPQIRGRARYRDFQSFTVRAETRARPASSAGAAQP